MSLDAPLRELEVQVLEGGDALSNERLVQTWKRLGLDPAVEWVRLGRGWFGEKLPSSNRGKLAPHDGRHGKLPFEKEIYSWIGPGPIDSPYFSIQLVYVPRGECADDGCCAHGERDMACERNFGGFYLGRFPVMGREFERVAGDPPPRGLFGDDFPRDFEPLTFLMTWEHPKWLEDWVVPFLARTGLRLPTLDERNWAMLGGFAQSVSCPHTGGDVLLENGQCRCLGLGKLCRELPWGLRKVRLVHPPMEPDMVVAAPRCTCRAGREWTPDRPLVLGPPVDGFRHHCWACRDVGVRNGGRGPVSVIDVEATRREGKIVPARPQSASWCGAQDMVFHVRELVGTGHEAAGESWRDAGHPELIRDAMPVQYCAEGTVGFRVALSGEASQNGR